MLPSDHNAPEIRALMHELIRVACRHRARVLAAGRGPSDVHEILAWSFAHAAIAFMGKSENPDARLRAYAEFDTVVMDAAHAVEQLNTRQQRRAA